MKRTTRSWHHLRAFAMALLPVRNAERRTFQPEIPHADTPDAIAALREETLQYNRRRGLYSEIARKLGVTPAHVRNVAMGLRRSRRVQEELDKALTAKGEIEQQGSSEKGDAK